MIPDKVDLLLISDNLAKKKKKKKKRRGEGAGWGGGGGTYVIQKSENGYIFGKRARSNMLNVIIIILMKIRTRLEYVPRLKILIFADLMLYCRIAIVENTQI